MILTFIIGLGDTQGRRISATLKLNSVPFTTFTMKKINLPKDRSYNPRHPEIFISSPFEGRRDTVTGKKNFLDNRSFSDNYFLEIIILNK
jgi:hypothetical protein